MVSPVRGTLPTDPPDRPRVRSGWAVARHEASQLDRIESKLDALLAALADEEVDTDRTAFSLDGEPVDGGERNQEDEL